MPEDSFLYMIDSMVKTCKWFALQALLFFLMPYVWDYEYSGHTIKFKDKHHYLLANIALVGEAIMLAMRTHK